jgi:hypothetical protein
MREELIAVWRKLHSNELHAPYSLPHVKYIGFIKSRRMRWAKNVASMGNKGKRTQF